MIGASHALLTELRPDGCFEGLVRRRDALPGLADVQLRWVRGSECHASLYIGLTSVLDVHERSGLFRLRTHRTHQVAAGFDPAWSSYRSREFFVAAWPDVEAYLDRLLSWGAIDPRWYRREGTVQALLAAGTSPDYGPVQREAVVWSDSGPSVSELVAEISDVVWAAVQEAKRSDPWWPGIRDGGKRLGIGEEVDVLALDAKGRLLCVEVKPSSATAGIVWPCAQVFVYAEIFARWVAQDPAAATESLRGMATQRAALGLMDPRWISLIDGPRRVAPVVAVGAGLRSLKALSRLALLADVLATVPRHPWVDPLEVWLLDEPGHPAEIWRPSVSDPPVGSGSAVESAPLLGTPPADDNAGPGEPDAPPQAAADGSFVKAARRAAAAWKATTQVLPEAARVPAPYGSGRGSSRSCCPSRTARSTCLLTHAKPPSPVSPPPGSAGTATGTDRTRTSCRRRSNA